MRKAARSRARPGACRKTSASAGVLEGKEGPALCFGKNRDLKEFSPFFSTFVNNASPPSPPDPSAIKQRFLFWRHCASSSDFRELWERLLTRNLELSCLRALPAHFPELSSRQCMRDFYQVWQEVCGPGTCYGRRYPARCACLSTPAARTAKPAKLQQTDRSLQQQARNATRTRLQLLSLQVKLLG